MSRFVKKSIANVKIVTVSMLMLAFSFEFANAQPSLPFLKRKRRENVENRELTVKDGPWLIMCASFSGENSMQSAMMLANELKRYRLQTYIYRHSFDYSGSFTGLGWQQPDAAGNFSRKPLKMKSANLDVVEETAVLVGDFPAIDDARAQRTLQQLKELTIQIPGLSDTTGKPLRTAFFLPNPMLPDEYFKQPKIDSFILNLNKKLEFSLLKCPGLYTVKVASFRGESTIAQGKVRYSTKLHQDGMPNAESRLVDAEEKAHQLTQYLRRKGIEAYEFHDRTESFVCVGSFDWVTRKTNERVMNNPDIVKLVDACKPEVRNLPGAPNSILPKSVKGIPFDPEPTPIMVPRYERGSRTANRLGFLQR